MPNVKKAQEALNEAEETRAKNKENNAKFTTKDGKTYLKEGVTGAQLQQAKLDTNRNHHRIQSNISQCIRNAQKADVGYFSSLNKTNKQVKSMLRPQELVRHLSDWELTLAFNSLTNEKRGYVKFTVWGTLTAIKRHLDGKEKNPNAIKFFDALDENNMKGIAEAYNSAMENVLKKRAEKEEK